LLGYAGQMDSKMHRILHVFTAAAIVLISYFLFLFFAGWFDFTFAKGSITVLEATYGQSCGARAGNATGYVAKSCTGIEVCTIHIDVNQAGDPAVGCEKEFAAKYNCGPDRRTRSFSLRPEANGKALMLDCRRG
jgi:hypothetical protein